MTPQNDRPSAWSSFSRFGVCLRDAAAYLLPGILFLVIGIIQRRIQLERWPESFQMPVFAKLALFLGMAYLGGHVLAAIYFLPFDSWRVWQARRRAKTRGQVIGEPTPEEMYYKARNPGMFADTDRGRFLTLLRGALAVALVAGGFMFCEPRTWVFRFLVGAGVVTALSAYSGGLHQARVRDIAVNAARRLQEETEEQPADLAYR